MEETSYVQSEAANIATNESALGRPEMQADVQEQVASFTRDIDRLGENGDTDLLRNRGEWSGSLLEVPRGNTLAEEAEPASGDGHSAGREEGGENRDGVEAPDAWTSPAMTAGGSGRIAGLSLPVARVKRLVKAEGDVQYLTAEAGILITRATELFLEAVAGESSATMLADTRSTLLYRDVAFLVAHSQRLEFLSDIVPRKVHPPKKLCVS